ncbi:MAG: small subunit ribosomal protein S9 [Parcubacteria group bacterium Gr01-1014_72]|nr:MAG: small subunit ribosomal protein S9 [Parcubacteria group bacterium Gr01-1014_72]
MTAETKSTTGTIARYIEAVGRRKTAVARVRITPSAKQEYVINGKDLNSYFPTTELRRVAMESFERATLASTFRVSAKLSGGGIAAQSVAFRHATARALVSYDAELRKKLKKAGFLKRDPRAKERRKFGLKKARKAPQWAKR